MAPRVNRVEAALRRVALDLDELGQSWALVGGLAVSAHAEPRTTRDVDIALAVRDDAAAEAAIFALSGLGYSVEATVEQTAASRLATARLHPPRERSVFVDLLFASSGIEAEIASAARRIDVVPGLTVPVATIGHLIAMKVLSRDDENRPLDLADLHALLREATPDDLELARSATARIVELGYNRHRDLEAELAGLLGVGRR